MVCPSTYHNYINPNKRDHSSLVDVFGKATAVQSSPSPPQEERVGIKVNLLSDFDAKAMEKGESNHSKSLQMPQRVNLHKLGLRRSKRIAEQKSKVKHKAHVTYGACAKQFLEMFALICTVNTYEMPSH